MRNPRPVRLGVLGAGDFGLRHIATAAALPEVELCAVADVDAAAAATAAQEYEARCFTDAAAMFSGERPDAVVIATPERVHLDNLMAALDADVHVLIEKPIVARDAEIVALRQAVASTDRVVLPAHVSRYLPSFELLRRRVADQKVVAVRAIRTVPRDRLDMHGGEHPGIVAMVHDIDLVHAIVPAQLREVTSTQRWTDPDRPYPQIVMANLQFSDGTVASVENHWTLPHERQYIDARLEVTTSEEILHLATPAAALQIIGQDGDHRPDTELDAWVAGTPVGALATQLRHFAHCVRRDRPSNVVTVEDALWAVDVANRITSQMRKPPTF